MREFCVNQLCVAWPINKQSVELTAAAFLVLPAVATWAGLIAADLVAYSRFAATLTMFRPAVPGAPETPSAIAYLP